MYNGVERQKGNNKRHNEREQSTHHTRERPRATPVRSLPTNKTFFINNYLTCQASAPDMAKVGWQDHSGLPTPNDSAFKGRSSRNLLHPHIFHLKASHHTIILHLRSATYAALESNTASGTIQIIWHKHRSITVKRASAGG